MPVYLDIATKLDREVREQYAVGEFLPSESSLAERFAVNRHTLRRAIDELVNSGLIQRHQGKGNRVMNQPDEYVVHADAKFTKNLIEQGARPRCEVIQSRIIVAPSQIAVELNIAQGDKIIHLRTLRKTEISPRTVIDHYLVDPSWWNIIKNYSHGSLHEFMKRGLGIELERKRTRVGAKEPTNEECSLLDIDKHTPILTIKTHNIIKGTDRVAEFSYSHSRSDTTEIVMEH